MRQHRLTEAVRILVLLVLLILADVVLALIAIELFQAIAWWEAAEGAAGPENLRAGPGALDSAIWPHQSGGAWWVPGRVPQ